jgi:hypothetical protein
VWEAYARYLYLDRLRDIDTLCACVAEAPASTSWEREGVGVAESYDAGSNIYAGIAGGSHPTSVRGTTLLVQPAIATAQLAALEGQRLGDEEMSDTTADESDVLRRFYGVVAVDAERLGRDASRIAAEVVAHLAGLLGSETEVTIEIRATNDEGFPDDVVRVVTENAAALRFRQHGFEKK